MFLKTTLKRDSVFKHNWRLREKSWKGLCFPNCALKRNTLPRISACQPFRVGVGGSEGGDCCLWRGGKRSHGCLIICLAFPGLYSHIWTPLQLLTQAGFTHSCLATKLCLTLLPPRGRLQCRRGRRRGLHPWVGKIAWRRQWQPSPVFSGYSPWGHK